LKAVASYNLAVTQAAIHQPIKVLPALVANQIAAGEVVERPASVVKELVENALDAGAERITVELEQGGIELVRVTDDGRGMPEADLPLAVAPHATSKIASVDDLDRIGTLGFRGEALASIASVSRLSIRSRTAEQTGAAVIDVEGDRVSPAKPAPGAVGTSVTVRNLFFNTPARRKFLRTVATEQERCIDALRQLAIAHPAVGFTVSCDGRVTLDVPAQQSPPQRAVAVLGKELREQLLEVQADEFDDSRGIAMWGLAGLPSIARGTNKHQHIFVNGRAVRDRTVQHAISEAYRGLIEPSRYPTVIVMLEMSPAGVDVNVHPQKAEVRFRDSSLVHSVVLRALRRTLQAADLTPLISAIRPAYAQPTWQRDLPGAGAMDLPRQEAPTNPAEAVSRFVEYFKRPTASAAPLSYEGIKSALEAGPAGGQVDAPVVAEGGDAANQGAEAAAQSAMGSPRPADRVLQVHNSYLVTQDDQGVVIIDQHALHERVMFEYLLARVAAGPLESQHLLAPAVVPAPKAQMDKLAELGTLLERIGVSAAPMGPGTIGVHSFPSFLFDRNVDPVEFMSELLEKAELGQLSGDMKTTSEHAMRDVLDMMACKAAVKAGDRMSDLELGELVRLRSDVERSSNCPHGRPTSIRLSIRELEKLFGRS
jgi:DNA mismatch repair protein MutL